MGILIYIIQDLSLGNFSEKNLRRLRRSSALQQPENSHAVRRSNVDLSMSNHRSDELFAFTKIISPRRCLVAVVEFMSQMVRVIRVQDRRFRIFGGPNNAISRPVRRDTRQTSVPSRSIARIQ